MLESAAITFSRDLPDPGWNPGLLWLLCPQVDSFPLSHLANGLKEIG